MKKLFSLSVALMAIVVIASMVFPDFVGAKELAISTVGMVAISAFIPGMNGVYFNTIGLDAARSAVTNSIFGIYKETVTPTSFLRSFFTPIYKPTRLVSFEVKRGNEKIAVDILRGTGTNLNSKKRSTLKTLEPPMYAEGYNQNELEVYDTAYATLDPTQMALLAAEAADELIECRNRIERAYEKQCADVLVTGVITLNSGDNIDFKRKAGSLVDGGGATYWTVNTVDPMAALAAGGKFIRENGKAQGGVYNVIMGGSALNALENNPVFQAKYDKKDIKLGEVSEPQRNATGGTLHGRVSAGSYMYNIWTYPEGYTNSAGVWTKYIPDTHIIVLPETTQFNIVYSLVPQLPGMSPMTSTEGGAYVLNEYVDPKFRNHVQEVLSAGAAIPKAIDTIYTQKVTAS